MDKKNAIFNAKKNYSGLSVEIGKYDSMAKIALKKRKMFQILRATTDLNRRSPACMDGLVCGSKRFVKGKKAWVQPHLSGCVPSGYLTGDPEVTVAPADAFFAQSFLSTFGSIAAQRLSMAIAIGLQQSNAAAHTTPFQF